MILHADVYVLCVCIVGHGHGYTTSGHDTRVTWIPFFVQQAAGHVVQGTDFHSYLPFKRQSWGLLIQTQKGRGIDLPFPLLVAYHVTPFSLFQVFHFKLRIPHRILNWTLYLNHRDRLFHFC